MRNTTDVTSAGQSSQHRALGGWLVLAVRQGVLTVLTLVGVVVLGRLLGPADFATYGYTTIGVTAALAVGDLGMSARVIRDEPATLDLSAMLGAQLAVVGLAAVAAATALGLLAPGVDVAVAAAAVTVAVLLAALQSLPTAMLERRLDFVAVSRIEVGQRALFVALAMALAAGGAGIASVPVAAVTAGVFGYWSALRRSGWSAPPRWAGLRSQLSGFGAAWWQGRAAAQMTYLSYPVLGGLLFTATEVGYLSLALTVTSLATLLAPLVVRATFPAMSAVDPADRVAIFRAVYRPFVELSVLGLALLVVVAGPLVQIALGPAWSGAVRVIQFTCLPTLVGIALSPSLALLYVVLAPRVVTRAVLIATALTWVAIVPISAVAGFYAPAIAGAVVAGGMTVWLDSRLRAAVGSGLIEDLAVPLALGGLAALFGLFVGAVFPGTIGPLAGGLGTAAIYTLGMRRVGSALGPRELLAIIRPQFRHAVGDPV